MRFDEKRTRLRSCGLETSLSAQALAPAARARLSEEDADQGRAQGFESAPRQGTPALDRRRQACQEIRQVDSFVFLSGCQAGLAAQVRIRRAARVAAGSNLVTPADDLADASERLAAVAGRVRRQQKSRRRGPAKPGQAANAGSDTGQVPGHRSGL